MSLGLREIHVHRRDLVDTSTGPARPDHGVVEVRPRRHVVDVGGDHRAADASRVAPVSADLGREQPQRGTRRLGHRDLGQFFVVAGRVRLAQRRA